MCGSVSEEVMWSGGCAFLLNQLIRQSGSFLTATFRVHGLDINLPGNSGEMAFVKQTPSEMKNACAISRALNRDIRKLMVLMCRVHALGVTAVQMICGR